MRRASNWVLSRLEFLEVRDADGVGELELLTVDLVLDEDARVVALRLVVVILQVEVTVVRKFP